MSCERVGDRVSPSDGVKYQTDCGAHRRCPAAITFAARHPVGREAPSMSSSSTPALSPRSAGSILRERLWLGRSSRVVSRISGRSIACVELRPGYFASRARLHAWMRSSSWAGSTRTSIRAPGQWPLPRPRRAKRSSLDHPNLACYPSVTGQPFRQAGAPWRRWGATERTRPRWWRRSWKRGLLATEAHRPRERSGPPRTG